MLQIKDLTYRIAGRPLFENANASVPAGHRVGLVGRNGTGKSTLFRLILGEISADGGSISLSGRARIGVVAQEAPAGPQSLLDFVLAADVERAELLAEAEAAHDPDRIAEVHDRLNAIDAHTAPARAASILAGLGFDEVAQARSLESWSGGWRMRVALAAVLFARPDLLLLDEPSNHLDLEAVLWLQNYLRTWPGTFILISHDRALLNIATTHILHLDNRQLTLYRGNYDTFEKVRRERLDQQAAQHARQVLERKHIQSFIDRFSAKASKARQAQSRVKMLARMEPIAAVAGEREAVFTFPQPEELSPPLIALDGISIGYGDAPPVLHNLDLRIDMDDRIALLGANGNGKSTLSRLLAGRLQARAGKVQKSSKLRTGYFAQHQMEELTPTFTAYQQLQKLMPLAREHDVRARLGQFGFVQNKANTLVKDLSGGEKSRLLFAIMSHGAPQMIILDEPTNHLDIDARRALVAAINDYSGAVILVSHDRDLIELCADRLWLVEGGTVKNFDGDLDEYERLLLDRRRGANRDAPKESAASRRDARREAAGARANAAPLRKAVQKAEQEMAKLERDRAEVEALLADQSLYSGPRERVADLLKRQGEMRVALEAAEARWLEAQEKLEEAVG